MIINKDGMRYTYNGTTYTIGAAVVATEESEYQGLCGIITEIRDGVDRETENDTPDIYCCFETPLFQRRSMSWSSGSLTSTRRPRSSTRSRWIWLSWHQRWFG